MAIRNKDNKIGYEISAFFLMNGITHKEAAERLGYASVNSVDNYISRGKFGKRAAEKWAAEFGFNEKFLMTGKGKPVKISTGYQQMKRECQTLRAVVLAQKKIIKTLTREVKA